MKYLLEYKCLNYSYLRNMTYVSKFHISCLQTITYIWSTYARQIDRYILSNTSSAMSVASLKLFWQVLTKIYGLLGSKSFTRENVARLTTTMSTLLIKICE